MLLLKIGLLVPEMQTVEGFAKQKKTNMFPLISSMSKPIFASSDPFCLITSQLIELPQLSSSSKYSSSHHAKCQNSISFLQVSLKSKQFIKPLLRCTHRKCCSCCGRFPGVSRLEKPVIYIFLRFVGIQVCVCDHFIFSSKGSPESLKKKNVLSDLSVCFESRPVARGVMHPQICQKVHF